MKIKIILILCTIASVTQAQIVERERPAEWDSLVEGGRFMDRFLPMQGEKLTSETWGAPGVRPRFTDNGIEHPDISFWGGNIMKDDNGEYHLYVCGWNENEPKGHMFWPKSTVYHAVSRNLHGPYEISDTIGKGHNPEAFRLDDGRIVVYVIDGYYIADSFNGPWEYSHFEFDRRDRPIIEGLSNLTFARRPDGSRLMVCRGGGTWVSRTGLSPYRQISDHRAYPDVDGRFEDPLIWRDSLQYHLIVNDWLGRIAFYERSIDGVNWVVEPGEAYIPGISRHKDGHVEDWFKYERIKVFQDEKGRAVQMNFAVIDTLKNEDKGSDNHSSKNICIPVRKDLILEVLNTDTITESTPSIAVLIKGEKGFKPLRDLDVNSLRFGSYKEVNFGRGARPESWKKLGHDLVVYFSGVGSGIDSSEFAPKLIGRDKEGELVLGYAHLPYINYNPAVLSALRPVYDPAEGIWNVEVENFGLSASEPTELTISTNGLPFLNAEMPSLAPYEKKTIKIPGTNPLIDPTLVNVTFR